MSKNNLLKKSDKKFIRSEKSRIRATVLDFAKQEELINNLYKTFLPKPKLEVAKEPAKEKEAVKAKEPEVKKEIKKAKTKKISTKK